MQRTATSYYVRASNATGSAWGTPVLVDGAGDVGWCTSLIVADGKPALAYYDNTNFILKYIRSIDSIWRSLEHERNRRRHGQCWRIHLHGDSERQPCH